MKLSSSTDSPVPASNIQPASQPGSPGAAHEGSGPEVQSRASLALNERKLTSTYISTIPFRTLAPQHAVLPDPSTVVETGRIFSTPHLLHLQLETLLSGFFAKQPHSMDAKLDDPDALRKAITAYSENLQRIAPDDRAVRHAIKHISRWLQYSVFPTMQAINREAREHVLTQLRDRITALKSGSADIRATPADDSKQGPDIIESLQNSLEMLIRIHEDRMAYSSSVLDARAYFIQELEEQVQDPEIKQTLGQLERLFVDLSQLRNLQDRLLSLQRHETAIAIRYLPFLQKRTRQLVQHGHFPILTPIDRWPRDMPPSFDGIKMLQEISRAMLNQGLLRRAKALAGEHVKKIEVAMHAGKPLGNTLAGIACTTGDSRLLNLVSHSHAVLGGSAAEVYLLWLSVMHQPEFTHQEKCAFTTKLYRDGKMAPAEALYERHQLGKVDLLDLEIALQAVTAIPENEGRVCQEDKAALLDDWQELLLEYQLPVSLGDLYVRGLSLEPSPDRVQIALGMASDQTAKAEIAACLATGARMDLNDFLQQAIQIRKPECVALLLEHHPLSDTVPEALAQSLSYAINEASRPRDAGHIAMLQVIRHLVEAGFTTRYRDDTHRTLLHVAVSLPPPSFAHEDVLPHQLALIQALATRGADLNGTDRRCRTPLGMRVEQLNDAGASAPGDDMIVTALRAHGGSVEQAIRPLEEALGRLRLRDDAIPQIIAGHHRLIGMLNTILTTDHTRSESATTAATGAPATSP